MATRTSWQCLGYDFVRLVVQVVGTFVFRIRCGGREKYPLTGGALVYANHQSFLDPALIGCACPRRMNYLARKTLFHVPVLGSLIQFLNSIPIDRDGFGLEGLKVTLQRIREGEMVLLFPEGTRSPDGNMIPLKPGICTLARRAKAPLVPVAIDGSFQAWPRHQTIPWPTTVRIEVGEPLLPEQIAELSDEQLLAELELRLRQCLATAQTKRNRSHGADH